MTHDRLRRLHVHVDRDIIAMERAAARAYRHEPAEVLCLKLAAALALEPSLVRAKVGDLSFERVYDDVMRHGDFDAAIARARAGVPIPPLPRLAHIDPADVERIFRAILAKGGRR